MLYGPGRDVVKMGDVHGARWEVGAADDDRGGGEGVGTGAPALVELLESLQLLWT